MPASINGSIPTVGNFANSAPGLPGGRPAVGTGPKAADSKFDPAGSVLVKNETTPPRRST